MKRAILIALLVASCGKGKANDDKATPPAGSGSATMAAGSGSAGSGSAAMAAGSGSAGSAAAVPVDVPTEMDFESQAKAKITDKNVEAQAKALEDDLGKQ